jgi:hypothetical protein
LIAANVGAMRDHKQSDRIEELSRRSEALDEQGDRQAEQTAQMITQLVGVEQLLSDHVHTTLREHSTQLAELQELLQAIHAQVVVNGAGPAASAVVNAPVAAPASAPDDFAAASEKPTRPPRRPRS